MKRKNRETVVDRIFLFYVIAVLTLKTTNGHALFLVLALVLLRSEAEPLRAFALFYGPYICAFAFALSRSFFLRSYFRTHTAIIYSIFIQHRTGTTGQTQRKKQNRTGRTDRQNRIGRRGQAEEDRITGQAEQDWQNRTGRTGLAKQDCQENYQTVLPRQDCQDRTAQIQLPGQGC